MLLVHELASTHQEPPSFRNPNLGAIENKILLALSFMISILLPER